MPAPSPSAQRAISSHGVSRVELPVSPAEAAAANGPHDRSGCAAAAWILAAALPLVGLVSLLLREQLDPDWDNHRVHFVLFLAVGARSSCSPTRPARRPNRRGDARVLLISLAFLATGGFLGLHALGTRASCSRASTRASRWPSRSGSCSPRCSRVASAFVDLRPALRAVRGAPPRGCCARGVVAAMAVWFVWTVAELPPLDAPEQRGRPAQRAGRAGRRRHRRSTPSRRCATGRLPRQDGPAARRASSPASSCSPRR